MPDNTVKNIIIYPIKGLKGISVDMAVGEELGLQNDRRYMLVDDEGVFVSQREFPQMCLFDTAINKNNLRIRFESDEFEFNMTESTADYRRVSVWSSKLKAETVSEEIDNWFSERMHKKLSLVKITDNYKRYKRLFVPPFKTHVSFADGYPYLVLGTASVEYLNGKLHLPVLADRFRANILVETTKAHEEDGWQDYQIGKLRLKNIKPCARCTVITIDQESAIKSAEPMKTLASYRKKGNKILFGVNAVCLDEGRISVGERLIF